MEILTRADHIFEHGNKHMATKLRLVGKTEGSVIKFIISKLRLFQGKFFMKYKAIAEELSCSYKTVQRAVNHAMKLGIFQVSERTEPTLDGKNRKTTNLIELLPYYPFEIVRGVVKVIKKVKSVIKLVDLAEIIISRGNTPKQEQTTRKNQYKPQNSGQDKGEKTLTCAELLPSWWEESTIEIKEKTEAKKEPDPTITKARILERLRSAGF